MTSCNVPKKTRTGNVFGFVILCTLGALLLLPSCAAAADNGFIAVSSTPDGARIFIDGVLEGLTPQKFVLAPGEHTIEVKKAGYQDFKKDILLHPLQSLPVHADLIPLPATGTVVVTSTPSSARVFIDEVMVGTTPYSGPVTPGAHTIKVSMAHYESYDTTVTVVAGKTVSVNANLVYIPQTGAVSVFSTPSGATVSFDGVLYGATPVTVDLAPGSHSLKVSMTMFADYLATITVTAGQTTPVYATLVPGTSSVTISPTGATTSPQITSLTTPGTQASGMTGSLALSSRPAGAKVYLDGVYIGITPAGVRSAAAGPHQLLFTMGGYEDFSTTVQVIAGESQEFMASLVPSAQGMPTKAPGFGAILSLAGVVAGMILITRKH